MHILSYLKYTPKESIEIATAELLESKKWRTTRSLWLVFAFLTFGLISWVILLFQGFRFRSQLAKTYGFIHLALFLLYSGLDGAGSSDPFWVGLFATLVAVCGIAFPLYVNRELLVCKAEKAVASETWLSKNLPGTNLKSEVTVNRLKTDFQIAKDNLKAVIEEERNNFSQLTNEQSQLKPNSDTTLPKESEQTQEPTSPKIVNSAAPSVNESESDEVAENEAKSNDLRADGQARGTRRLDF